MSWPTAAVLIVAMLCIALTLTALISRGKGPDNER